MTRIATLSLPHGIRVVVPDGLHLITPYVLFEQHDWFEDEIKFLRHVLQAGDRVVDIGANYGVYAFSMARSVGPQGAVFAFEPASSTADFLQQGIDANGFTHIVLERSALSDSPGSARLATSEHAELNALDHGQSAATGGETVRVVTLDGLLRSRAWPAMDFVKIDAEGEEARIIRGGNEFFSRFSPLVMYEVKAGSAMNLDLVEAFAALGYQSFRLIPGLDVLTPFDASQVDDFLLNLFCCKPDRAELLARRGLLVHAVPDDRAPQHTDPCARLTTLPYGARLAPLWRASAESDQRSEVERAIADYLASQDTEMSAQRRISALRSALSRLQAVCAVDATPTRLASLARVAAGLGERSLAVRSLARTYDAFVPGQPAVDLSEPFLAPTRSFDTIEPGDDVSRWLHAAVLEAMERLSAFSSYFTGREALQRLEAIASLGYAREEMQRRLQLVRLKFPGA